MGKDMSVTPFYPPAEIESLLVQYSPLVRAVAAQYSGRGAEYEDLVQEGYLALVRIIPKCRDRQWLAAFLKNRLPGYVRAAAVRLRKCAAAALEDEFANMFPDGRSGEERGEIELRELLERTLSKDELDLTQALLEGFTQKELAVLLGISQQAVSGRLQKIRDKLAPVLILCERRGSPL